MRFKIMELELRIAPSKADVLDIGHTDHACINIVVDKNHPVSEIDIHNTDHTTINIIVAQGCQAPKLCVDHTDHTSLHAMHTTSSARKEKAGRRPGPPSGSSALCG